MKFKIFICLFAYLLILAFAASSANAQGVDIGIYPPIFQIQAVPPSNIKLPLIIQNFGDSSLDLTISLKPFTASDTENGEITFLDNPEYEDPYLLQRVRVFFEGVSIDSITLSPKQKRDLVLEFDIPSNEPKGEYYFSIIFSSKAQDLGTSTFSGASASVASNVLLSIGPLGKTQGLIEEFSSPYFVTKGPVPFTIRVRNTSDHYITPKGDILIKNMFGQTVGKVNLLGANILSNNIRRIPDSLQSGTVSDKDYEKIRLVVEKNKSPVAVWPEKFLLGPYNATLTVSLSDEGPVFKRKIYFFAIPLEYSLGILAIIAIVAFIIVRVRKRIS